MKKYLIRFAVALLTFSIGGTVSEISNRLHRLAQWHGTHAGVQADVRSVAPNVTQMQTPDLPMPKSLSPYDIENFINENPQANLSKLWQSLGIPKESQRPGHGLAECGQCRAESYEYDLDGEPGAEVLLRVADGVAEAYRYLAFKSINHDEEAWRLLGHIDAWGKYEEPSHTILLSDGKPWLIVRDQGASGSGVALYLDRLFQVSPRGLKEIVSYSAEGHQFGESDEPTRDFYGRVKSLEINDGRATVTIGLTVEYSMLDSDQRHFIPLFTKQQQAVLVRQIKSKTPVFDSNRSNLSMHEFDAVYNIDSLFEDDFLKYNYKELSQIAIGRAGPRKEWLRKFLRTCEHTSEHGRLARLLAQ